ncbi:Wzy polymerase domain-containing protein [Pseudoalteromonas sp.]|uniref:PglL family O-oligosaccharyltransferase n=1 Tax=Pseudoalteromonas sp. TaxID=53249 RepID=UPI0035642016
MTNATTQKTTNTLVILLAISFFLIPFLPTYTLGFDGLAEPINSAAMLPLLMFGYFSFKRLSSSETFYLEKSIVSLLVVCIFGVIIFSFYPSSNFSLPTNTHIRITYIFYFACFIQLLFWVKPSRISLMTLLFYFLLFQLVIGYYQFFISEQTFQYTSGKSIKVVGLFPQVNVYATVITTGVLLSIYILNTFRCSKRFYYLTIPSYFFLLASPFILYITASKTAILGLSFALITFVFFKLAKKQTLKFKSTFLPLMTGILISIISFSFAQSEKTTESFTNVSSRVHMYEHSLWMIQEKPLLGWGVNNFQSSFHYSLIERSQNDKTVPLIDNALAHPHNEFLLWWIELGLLGFIFISLVFLVIIAALLRNKKPKNISWALIILIPILFHSQVEKPFYSSTYIAMIFCLVFYIFSSSSKVSFSKKYTASVLSFSFLAITLTTPFIWISALSSMVYTGNYTIDEKMNAKKNILLSFPAREYTLQSDLLIESFLNQGNSARLIETNQKILEQLYDLPAESLAITYLLNCKKISCDKRKVDYVKNNFPFAFNRLKNHY